MRRSNQIATGSLELLLDTMCNTFGAIILITLLVALLTRGVHEEAEGSAVSQAELEMLNRQVARAEADLARSQAPREVPNGVPDQLDTGELRASIAAIKTKTKEIEMRISEAGADHGGTESGRMRQALENLRGSRGRAASARDRLLQAEANLRHVEERRQQLGSQIAGEREKRTVKLRLPRERSKSKAGVSVLVRYGEAFPVVSPSLDRNTSSIRWEEDGGGDKAIPIRGEGIATQGASISSWKTFLQGLPKANTYLIFYVYHDSVSAFRQLKEAAVAENFDYGWEPVAGQRDLIFSESGSSPPPL